MTTSSVFIRNGSKASASLGRQRLPSSSKDEAVSCSSEYQNLTETLQSFLADFGSRLSSVESLLSAASSASSPYVSSTTFIAATTTALIALPQPATVLANSIIVPASTTVLATTVLRHEQHSNTTEGVGIDHDQTLDQLLIHQRTLRHHGLGQRHRLLRPIPRHPLRLPDVPLREPLNRPDQPRLPPDLLLVRIPLLPFSLPPGLRPTKHSPILSRPVPRLLPFPSSRDPHLSRDIQHPHPPLPRRLHSQLGVPLRRIGARLRNDPLAALRRRHNHLPLPSPLRPNVILDGFDIDNESGHPEFYDVFATTLKSLFRDRRHEEVLPLLDAAVPRRGRVHPGIGAGDIRHRQRAVLQQPVVQSRLLGVPVQLRRVVGGSRVE
ncbi:hypothetical protein MRB53_038300 [Persea americana]|nr:hypothetical protein MRB53_038300 [Persea americana]